MAITRPYTPQEWENGDVITKEKLDNIEAGIAAIDSEITGARGSGSSAGTLGKRIDDLIMVQDTQPVSEANEIWVRSTGNGVQVPTYEEFETLANNTVHINETQTFTDAQKETARGNIDAASEEEVSDLKSAVNEITNAVHGEEEYNYTVGKNFTATSIMHEIIDDPNSCISDYIPVTWGTDRVAFWYTDNASTDATMYQLWFFNSEKTFIDYYGRSTSNNYRVANTPANAAYARISFKRGYTGRVTEKSLTPSVIYYEAYSQIVTEGIDQKIGQLNSLDTENKTSIVDAINEITERLDGREKTLSASITSGAISKSLPFVASAGEMLYVIPSGTAFTGSQCYIYVMYDGDTKTTNFGLVDLGKKTYYKLNRGINTVYVYAAASSAQEGTVLLVAGVEGISDVADNVSTLNVLKGKKINYLGDSITHGPGDTNAKSYTAFLAKWYDCTTRNYGIVGSSLQNDPNKNPMCIRYADMDNDADIVGFMGGTNDYWYNLPLGVYGDNTDTTYYGALDVLIRGLIAKYPTALIYAVTPPHGYGPNFDGETKTQSGSMQDIADAVKRVAGKYSVPVLDVFNAGGLYPAIQAQSDAYYNSADGVHLTEEGQKKLARLHAAFLASHLPQNVIV